VARQREIGFSQIGRRIADLRALDDARRIAELERKIGQRENESKKNALQHFRDFGHI